MRNRDFSKLNNLEKLFNTLRVVAITITIAMSILMFIGGIIVCVYNEIATGISAIITSLIFGGFGTFVIYCSHMFAIAIIDAMTDIKQTSVVVEDMKTNRIEQSSVTIGSKSYETSTCYLLRYIEKGSYLSASSVEDRSLRVTKSIMASLKFDSEQEAEKFADYKGLSLDDKWDIVKKDLIIPIE